MSEKTFAKHLQEIVNLVPTKDARKFKGRTIIGDPYTILLEGNKKTIVKASEEDFNVEKGVVMALIQHMNIMSYAKLKYLIRDMEKGDPELVLAKFFLRMIGITGNDIKKQIKDAHYEKKNKRLNRESATKEEIAGLFKPVNTELERLLARIKESDKTLPVTQKLFNKKYAELTKEEHKAYRRHLAKINKSN